MTYQIKKQIAVKIRDYSRQVSLTQTDIAELCGTSQSKVSNIINLKLAGITLDSLFKMLQNLDINPTLTFE